jgi:hypothetical protein
MRISSIIRTIEDQVLGAGGKVAGAAKELYYEAELEARARSAVRREYAGEKAVMLDNMREAIRQTDTLHALKAKRAAQAATRAKRSKGK